jgi:hypothetical protein
MCVCARVHACLLPYIGGVTATDYMWLEQELINNSLLHMGFWCLGGHTQFILLNKH